MAPLPENNTDRYQVRYALSSSEHVLTVRTTSGVTATEINDWLDTWFLAVSPYSYLFTVTSIRFGLAGSTVTLPYASGLVGTSYGADAVPTEAFGWFLSVTGRGSTGRDVKLTHFGYRVGFANGYRVTPGESSTFVTAIVNAAQGNPNIARTIDEHIPVWNSYVNVGVNAYWQRESR
jgi:hypothetical protein